MAKRKHYEAKEKLLTSKPMARMREVAFGINTSVELHRLDVKLAARDDEAMLEAAERKRQAKAEKIRRQLEAQRRQA